MADTTPLVNFPRWSRTCMEVGVAPDERDYRRVRRGWRSMGRHYHTLSHLDACLHELDAARQLALRPAEVEMALWFHDVVYRSWRRDNEQQSAAMAGELLRAAPIEAVQRIRQMILDTRHHDEDLAGDAALVVDVDLAILGQPPETYEPFARAIRREYWWVPRARYRAARSALLQGFLARSSIYHHDAFYRRYEARARANVAAELERLAS
jgi:predicted metal-dependent HD superfamily phosphohydrolase